MAITICRSFRSITAFVVFLVLAIQTRSAQEPASQLGRHIFGISMLDVGNWSITRSPDS